VTDVVGEVVSRVHRAEWGRIVASLIGRFGDWDLAEECAQDAFAQALRTWPTSGVPDNPGAWLTTVARNRALDRLRRVALESSKLDDLSRLRDSDDTDVMSELADDRLRLIFTCCHPALPLEARVALTLRALGGLTTAEIARAFLVPEETMAKRLVRAKHKLHDEHIPYEVPAIETIPVRTKGVLAVLYLIFSEGYASSSGDFIRDDLCAEAIRLTRILVALLPESGEAKGLLALELFQNARRSTRVDEAGALCPLEEQNRSRWDAQQIDEGLAHLETTPPDKAFGEYQLQAAIAACHVTSRSVDATDWTAIVNLYRQLLAANPSPVVRLNLAIATGMADGPAVGLAALRELEGIRQLDDHYLFAAARADFQRRLGLNEEAAVNYGLALERAPSEPERRYLARRVAELAP
jgi:RNA polymerase sigma-70 factor (ECF subfamily)